MYLERTSFLNFSAFSSFFSCACKNGKVISVHLAESCHTNKTSYKKVLYIIWIEDSATLNCNGEVVLYNVPWILQQEDKELGFVSGLLQMVYCLL